MLPGKSYTPQDFLDIARRRFWLIVVPPVVSLFAALVYSATLPNLYQSDMLIGVVPQRVPSEFVRSTVTLRTEERLEAIAVQIMSRTMLEPIVTEFDLYPEERSRLPMEDVVNRMRANVQVELERPPAGRGSDPTAFHVRFTYVDPALATQVTQRLGSIFVNQNARDRGALARATEEFLNVQLTEARQRLEGHEKRLEAFRQQHGNALPSQLQSNLQAIQNVQLQIQALVEAIARDRDRKLMLERLYQEAANEAVAPPAAALQPSLGQTEQSAAAGVMAVATPAQQLAAARATLAALERRLTPEHPDIVRTRRIIEDLEAKAAAESREPRETGESTPAAASPPLTPAEALRRERLAQMRAEIESLDRLTGFKESEERRLRDLVTEYQRRIEAVPGLESEWAVLTRDYDTLQAAYRDLLNKSEAAKVALDLENRQIGEQFRVLDPASVPATPISPARPKISGMGLLAGLALGVGLVVLLEFKDASFRSEGDVLSALSLPVLAAVPYVETQVERRVRIRRRLLVSTVAVLAAAGAGYVFWAMRLWTVVV
jgi:polysaccharide chain length determinant protein (PEP-CTERM system associated)